MCLPAACRSCALAVEPKQPSPFLAEKVAETRRCRNGPGGNVERVFRMKKLCWPAPQAKAGWARSMVRGASARENSGIGLNAGRRPQNHSLTGRMSLKENVFSAISFRLSTDKRRGIASARNTTAVFYSTPGDLPCLTGELTDMNEVSV